MKSKTRAAAISGWLDGVGSLRVAVWLKERWRDALLWVANLVRDLPRRARRLGKVLDGSGGTLHLGPGRAPAHSIVVRLHQLLVCLFDLAGGPELAQYLMHMATETSPLTPEEREAIASVLGPRAIRYEDVRIAEGGILPLIFKFNGGRAFCAWHTIHLPRRGPYTRADLSLLVHEAVHVYQYEQIGSAYIGEALYAQRQLGRGAYEYGGEAGLRRARKEGFPFSAFNREAQAQIFQDYFRRRERSADVSAYRPYLARLRAGGF